MQATEIVKGLPKRFRPEVAEYDAMTAHLILSGSGGGEFTVLVEDGACRVSDGLQGDADVTVRASADTYVKIETGKKNPQMALMMGKIKADNLGALIKFISYFHRLSSGAT